ncbi:MAG: glycosyltransferase family 4 protein [Leptolyngbyaceae bacterium]|nr:glycosyltransferase family 4 protein [Leptolyngbyaceae bacterium]
MRILIYSYNYHPEPIGIAPLMTQLAEGLVKRGHQVRVITGMPNYPQRRIYDEYRGKYFLEEEKNGVTVQRSYVWVQPKPGLVGRMLLDASFVVTSVVQALRGWKPDIILLTVPPLPVSVPAALLGLFYACPVVLSLQDILPEAAIQVGLIKNKMAIRVFEALERFAYSSATAISVITEGFTKNLLSKGVPAGKMTCIPNWVDVHEIKPLPLEGNSFRRDHHLENKFVVMYSGNIALTQGMNTVIRAARLLSHIPDIVFVIVGEKSAIATLEETCQKLETPNVKLLEFQPREVLPQMLAAANVGLIVQKANVVAFNMPSKTQILLASGRPIIASVPSSGTAADAVRRSGGGLVVEPESPQALASSILELYENPHKAELLGQQGRQHALQHYAFEESLKRYEQLFMDVLARQGRTVSVSAPVGFSNIQALDNPVRSRSLRGMPQPDDGATS